MFVNRDIRKVKMNIRNACREIRSQMTEKEKSRADMQIFNRVINLWKYRECRTLLTYVSGAIEVDTHMLIEDALRRGKRVAVPRCIEGTREMEFFFITSFEDLEKGSYGILEPIKEKCVRLEDYSSGLCIIPALTFDERGYRLGFGKGYYDRFLSEFSGETAGLCYESCMRKELPKGRYDKHADVVVTEKRVISQG